MEEKSLIKEKVFNKFSEEIKSLLTLFFPKICVVCGRFENYICSNCFSKIVFLKDLPKCPKCSLPQSKVSYMCGECLKGERKFEKLFSVFVYDGVGEIIIKKIKYSGYFRLIEFFTDFFEIDDFDFIVPVPTYKRKYILRGYNTAERIAFYVSKVFRKPVLDCIEKVKDTPSQMTLPMHQRKTNLRGAFVLKEEIEEIKKVLIVDDVATTCSTISECAKFFKSPIAFTLARTPIK